MGPRVWGRFGSAMRWLASVWRDPGVRRGLWVLLFTAATAALFASVSLPREVNLRPGEVAPYSIKAPRDMIDHPGTLALQQAAEAKVAPVYRIDSAITREALGSFDAGKRAIDSARQELTEPPPPSSATPPATSSASTPAGAGASASSAAPPTSNTAALAAAVQTLRGSLGLPALPDSAYVAALHASVDTLDGVEASARARLQAAMDAGVDPDQADLDAARQSLQADILGSSAPGGLNQLIAALAGQSLQANHFEDPVATQAQKDLAAQGVAPLVIAQGQIIVREGDRVTPDDIVRLRDAGLLHPGGAIGVIAGAVLLALLFLGLCWAFLAQFHHRALADEAHLVLFGSVVIGALAAVRLGMQISVFLAPVAWAAMMAAVAFGPGVALFVSGIAGLGAGLMVRDLSVAVVVVAGAWTAVFSLRRLQQRSDLLRAGLYSAIAAAGAALLLVGLLLGQDTGTGSSYLADVLPSVPWFRAMAASAFAALLSGVLAIGTMPYAEALGVLTPFKLLELANPGQPLLRKLLVEAPGTYHHSLMVANLSEAACQAIGGDALLVRAGAYYHDIGKMKRPGFFVENQMGGENPHSKLSPQLSAMVITSHVRDGVEMARQARLPEEITAFIRTHHGTTLVQYFYHAARRESGAAESEGGGQPALVSEEDFRYEGPLPATRETAVVMLADGVEAAVRSLKQPTADEIEAIIHRIITDRLEDGQLDQASLTLKDVHTIGQTFRSILLGAYHARIAYPEALAAEVGGDEPMRPRLGLRGRGGDKRLSGSA